MSDDVMTIYPGIYRMNQRRQAAPRLGEGMHQDPAKISKYFLAILGASVLAATGIAVWLGEPDFIWVAIVSVVGILIGAALMALVWAGVFTPVLLLLSRLSGRGKAAESPLQIGYNSINGTKSQRGPGSMNTIAKRPLQLPKITFDRALERTDQLLNQASQDAKDNVADIIGLPPSSIKSFQFPGEGDKIEIIFSKETLEKLKSGEYHLPIDKEMGLPRVDVRDKKERIKELGKVIIKKGSKAKAALRLVVSAAHIVSQVDVAAKLEKIEKKIDSIARFIHADRLGELRGAYNYFQTWLHSDSPNRKEELRRLAANFRVLSDRFFQTATTELANIKDPSDIGVIQAIFSLQSTAETKLKDQISQILTDLRCSNFSSALQTICFYELEETEAMLRTKETHSLQWSEIRNQLSEKTGYLNLDLQKSVDEWTRVNEQAPALKRKPFGEPEILIASQKGN